MWGLHFQVTGQEPRQELEAETIENMLLGFLVKLRAAAQAMRPPTGWGGGPPMSINNQDKHLQM